MGAAIQCESFLSRHYSMRNLSEDSNNCSWSVHGGEKNLPYPQHQKGFSMRVAGDSHSGYEIDAVKQTMLEHEAIFKNQVHELHRLYKTQRNLMDGIKQKNLIENSNHSEATARNESTKQLMLGFLSGNLDYGRENGINSKDGEVLEASNVKAGRKMIDLQLPAEEYMDADDSDDPRNNTAYSLYEQSKWGNQVGGKRCFERIGASYREDFSRSGLGSKNLNCFTDLNKPVHCQESEPVTASKDIYSDYRRNNMSVQGRCLEKDTSQNGRMILAAGHDKSNRTDGLHRPFRSNNTFQHPGYALSDQGKAKVCAERTFCEAETRVRNTEVSYDSYVESSVASNAPSSFSHHPESVRPLGHCISSRDNPSSSSGQKFSAVQPNSFLNYNTQARANPGFDIRRRDFNEGSSSRSKEAVFCFPPGSLNHLSNSSNGAISISNSTLTAVKHCGLESLQGPKKNEECSAGISWLKPKPPCRSEIANGGLDLNASVHQFTDESETGNGFSYVSPDKSLRSASRANNSHVDRVEMNDVQSIKILGSRVYEKHPYVKKELSPLTTPHVDEDKSVKRDFDINVPCDAAVSIIDQRNGDEEENKISTGLRHDIDLNLCATEDEDSRIYSGVGERRKSTPWIDLEAPAGPESDEEAEETLGKTNEDIWGLQKMDEHAKMAAEAIVAMSVTDHGCHLDEAAACSSTDGPLKDPLAWFADTIASCGNDLETQIDACSEGGQCEGGREECSSGEFDYFEAMTLNIPETKEEDYMPKPLVPDTLKFDETGPTFTITNRARRGCARRGRPKRDFQRDILPGITSLSRQDVTEDLQTFEELMKATGYSWDSGVTRRNSNRGGRSNRGRRRLATNISRALACPATTPTANNEVEVTVVEDRSLTGWGRATRRPRRQRCPAGNPTTVVLI